MNKEYEPVWEQATAYRADELANPSAAPSVKSTKSAAAGVKQIVTIRLDVDMLEWYKSADLVDFTEGAADGFANSSAR